MSVQDHSLDEQQQMVADAPDGPLLVLAGAGTGKTRALTGRVAALVKRGVDPSRVLVVTFTQKAARAMGERLNCLLPQQAAHICSGTFHSIALRFLRIHGHRLNYGPSFRVLSGYQCTELFGAVLARQPEEYVDRLPDAGVMARINSLQVNSDRSLGAILSSGRWQFNVSEPELESVFLEYVIRKIELNAMDYDDLLANWLVLMMEYPDVLDAIRGSFDHVLVDEYQDINPLQARILDLLSCEHRNLTAVGDSRQAIYGFRGADLEHLHSFSARMEARTISLHQNYRSTPQIVAAANACDRAMLNGERAPLFAVGSNGEKPIGVAVKSHEQSAQFVAQRMRQLNEAGIGFSEQVVLYRTHLQGRAIQLELQRAGIPHTVRSGTRFFDMPHVRDAVAHLRIVTHPLDCLAWLRALKAWPGVGQVIGQRLMDLLLAESDPWEVLDYGHQLLSESVTLKKALDSIRIPFQHIRDRVLNGRPDQAVLAVLESCLSMHFQREDPEVSDRKIQDIERLMALCSESWNGGQLLDGIDLDGRLASDAPEQSVTLSTIHQSKGLEWDAVFLVGLIDGVFPLRPMASTEEHLQEERRLFYVALTRARRHLYLCHPPRDPGHEQEKIQWPSRFLLELDEYGDGLLEHWIIAE